MHFCYIFDRLRWAFQIKSETFSKQNIPDSVDSKNLTIAKVVDSMMSRGNQAIDTYHSAATDAVDMDGYDTPVSWDWSRFGVWIK